jgi:hypothetical protein
MDLVELIDGKRYKILLSPHACQDLCGCGIPTIQDSCQKDGVIGGAYKSNTQTKKKVVALLVRVKKYADSGRLVVPEHLNPEGDGFFAFKSGQVRAYWWREEKCIIISHFKIKKQQKLDKKDVSLMERHRKEYHSEEK